MNEALTVFRRFTTFALLVGSIGSAIGACNSSGPGRPGSSGAAGAGGNQSIGTAGTGGGAGSLAGGGGTGIAGGGAGGGGPAGSSGAAGGGGGAAGSGATGAAGSGAAGAGGSGAAGSGGTDGGVADGGVARFSFFVTSFAGLRKLSGNTNGFGGDLRFAQPNALAGADEICRRLADASMPGNGKTWRAFLSVTKGPEGTPVNAIDRVGNGPWYDRRGRLLAMTKAALLNTRPQGADPIIANDLPNEDGVPNHNPDGTVVDNHNFMTGSNTMGQLFSTNLATTCQDWTSSTAAGGQPRCGVTWPRVQFIHWISTITEGGCAPGATPPGADQGTPGTVGALGGYGGFYCFALTP